MASLRIASVSTAATRSRTSVRERVSQSRSWLASRCWSRAATMARYAHAPTTIRTAAVKPTARMTGASVSIRLTAGHAVAPGSHEDSQARPQVMGSVVIVWAYVGLRTVGTHDDDDAPWGGSGVPQWSVNGRVNVSL